MPANVGDTDGYYGLPANQVTGAGSFYDSLHLDPALVGRPIPTNHWWTDMLVANRSYLPGGITDYTHTQYILQQDPYGGNMWFYPGRLNAKSYGFDVYYPIAWKAQNAAGTNATIDPGPALPIHGDRGYSIPAGDVLVADFETGYPAGWTSTAVAGHANPFPTGPANSSWTGATPTGYLGSGYASSQLAGPTAASSNSNEGILTGSFTIQKHYVHLLVGGGSDTVNTLVRLKVGGSVVASASGKNSGKLAWVSWDVSAYANQTATIELVDTSAGSWGYILCDEIVQSDASDPTTRYGTDFTPTESVVTNWGDWNVDFKLPSDAGQEVDVTMARGIPFTWTRWQGGLKPKIYLPGTATTFTNTSGTTISTAGGSFVSNAFSFVYQGRTFGIFLPDSTTVTVASTYIEPQLSGSNNYMVIGYLPAASNLGEFANVAYARPTDTQLSWNYNPGGGSVTTNWAVTTTAMKGSNLNTIQGWLPHHYRTTTNSIPFSSYTYLTPRGTMKCATGTNFSITFPFRGLVPILPAPTAVGGTNDFQPARMQSYFNGFNPGTMIGETYGSGKGLGLCSQFMAYAAQSGDTTNFNRLKTALENALVNWFTYTPGEANGFFASYSDWHALIGFDASYGSQAFNDLHFHYGYFANAAATVGMYDPQFLTTNAPMLRQIVKSYANYDRNDTADPFLRTFDIWEGHSNAGGLSSPNGENQESSSEAMQSWAGLFLLGGVLNDSQMNAAGAMGFAMESAATNEYWENLWQTNFPSDYTRAWAAQVWGDNDTYATYFSADPAWVYGIQEVPSYHWLNYLTRYQPTQVTSAYNAMWTERNNWAAAYPLWNNTTVYASGAWIRYNGRVYSANSAVAAGGQSPDLDTTDWYFQADVSKSEPDVLGIGLGQDVLAYQALFDPDTAAAEFDNYYTAGEAIATGGGQAGSTYYLIHAMRQIGLRDFSSYTSAPLSSVYYNSNTGKYSYLVYNPSTTQQNVTVYKNGAVVGTFPVPAQKFINSHLDEILTRVVLTESNTAAVIQPGQTVQFTLTGYDQYDATYPLSSTAWSVSAGGTISTSGLFTATANAYPVTVTATSGGLSQTYTFRVGSAPVLNSVAIVPGFSRVVNGATQQYAATGYDQYGNPFTLGSVNWSATGGNGSIDASGLFTASALGTGYVIATSGGVSTTAVVAVHAALTNIALGKPVTGSSTNGTNVANNVTDSSSTTRWESAYANNQYIYIDLGKTYDLTSVYILWQNAYAKNYDVEVSSDLQTWTIVATPPTKTTNAPDTIALTNATGRYLKLNLVTRSGTFGFSIFDIQAFGYINAASITANTVQLNPANASVVTGQQQQFQAYAFDSNFDGGPTAATWAVSGGGTINSGGLFSATTVGGPYTVTGTVGTVSGTTGVTVKGIAPVITRGTPPAGTAGVAYAGYTITASNSPTSFAAANLPPGLSVNTATGAITGTPTTAGTYGTVNLTASNAYGTSPVKTVSITIAAGGAAPVITSGTPPAGTVGAAYAGYTITASNSPTSFAAANLPPGLTVSSANGVISGTPTTAGTYSTVNLTASNAYGTSAIKTVSIVIAAAGDTNLALGKTATASTVNGTHTANLAVDSSTTTRWESVQGTTADPSWIYVDLGAARTIDSVVLNWETAAAKNFKIQVAADGSDPGLESSWSLATPEILNNTSGIHTHTISPAAHGRYVRIYGETRTTVYGYSLYDLQVMGH